MDPLFLKALDIISQISPIENKCIGDIMVESGIISSEVYIYIHDGEALFLCNEKTSKTAAAEQCRNILSFIGLIQNLKNENLVFLKNSSNEDWVYGRDSEKFATCQNPDESELGNNLKLKRSDKSLYIERGNEHFPEISISPEISKVLGEYITCTIYPGSDYDKFKQRGYITPVEYSLKLSQKANNWACKAFIVAIISFLLSPFLSNWFGYSTINKEQFKLLIDTISNSIDKSTAKPCCDSSIVIVNDSSINSFIKNHPDVFRKKEKQ